MSIELVMSSDHFIVCSPLLVLPSIFPSIKVFSNESALHIAWPVYRSFSISPSSEYSGLISLRDRANANPTHFTGFGLSNMIKPKQALKSIQPFSVLFAEHLFYTMPVTGDPKLNNENMIANMYVIHILPFILTTSSLVSTDTST